MTTTELPTLEIELHSDENGVVQVQHGFGARPDSIISNSLEDTPAIPPKEEGGEPTPGILNTYAFAITGFTDTTVSGYIVDRTTGQPAPDTTLRVSLWGVFNG